MRGHLGRSFSINQAQFQLAFVVAIIALGLFAGAAKRPWLLYLALGLMIAIPLLDDAFQSYDDEMVVRAALALPLDVSVGRSGHGKTPACWAEGRRIKVPLTFPSAGQRGGFASRPPDADAIRTEVARFLERRPQDVSIETGALRWQKVGQRYSRDGAGKEWPTETADYLSGYVCAGIHPEAGASRLAIKACDPLDPATTRRTVGMIELTRPHDDNTVQTFVRFSSNGPACRNRVRHFFNRTFGLGDP